MLCGLANIPADDSEYKVVSQAKRAKGIQEKETPEEELRLLAATKELNIMTVENRNRKSRQWTQPERYDA